MDNCRASDFIWISHCRDMISHCRDMIFRSWSVIICFWSVMICCWAATFCSTSVSIRFPLRWRGDASPLALRFAACLDDPGSRLRVHGIIPGRGGFSDGPVTPVHGVSSLEILPLAIPKDAWAGPVIVNGGCGFSVSELAGENRLELLPIATQIGGRIF